MRRGFLVAAAAAFLGAPAFADESLGERLGRHAGEVVVLNFWASWCQPCVREMPLLQRLSARFASSGVVFIGANVDEPGDRKTARKLLGRLGVTYPVWWLALDDMKPLEMGTSLPATAVFDRGGKPVFRIIGEIEERVLLERLEWLTGSRSEPAPAALVLPPGLTAEHLREHVEGREEGHDHEPEKEGGSAVPG